LAAILAADVVGYSALMERNEEATYAEFERLRRELIEPSLARHDGRLIKTTGDGALAEFASPSAAVRCAVEIQESIASGRSPLKPRIGVNLGEVIVGTDGDLFGDGTNIAVRLEAAADPGGILISEKVYSRSMVGWRLASRIGASNNSRTSPNRSALTLYARERIAR
jgi:adenylate cyclase